jgi:hypothetical protein
LLLVRFIRKDHYKYKNKITTLLIGITIGANAQAPKQASTFTQKSNEAVYPKLTFDDTADFTDAKRVFITTLANRAKSVSYMRVDVQDLNPDWLSLAFYILLRMLILSSKHYGNLKKLDFKIL